MHHITVVEVIKQQYKKNTFQMLHLSSVMNQVCILLNENNINLLILKGPVLGVNLYGDVSLRTSSDLDILIPIKDLEKVENLLLKLGYEKDDYIQTVLNDWKWRHHHITFFHPQKGIKLEIHWRLNPGPAKEPNFDELWDRKRKSSANKLSYIYFGKRRFIFISCFPWCYATVGHDYAGYGYSSNGKTKIRLANTH